MTSCGFVTAFMVCVSILVASRVAAGMATGSKQGTPTRFFTESLPNATSRVTVRDSEHGNFMPSVANGYIGTVINSNAIYVSGVFNGRAYSKAKKIYPVYFYEHAHRARIPSTCAIEFKVHGLNGKSSFALDVSEGVFYRWYKAEKFSVEQRTYAHRSNKHLMIVEISVNNTLGKTATLEITSKRGNDSVDIEFVEVNLEKEMKAAIGKVNETEIKESLRSEVAIAWTEIPSVLTVADTSVEQTWYFITAIATSLDIKFGPLSEAVSQWSEAVSVKSSLLKTHKKAWKDIWDTGKVDIEGNLELSQSVYGSMYGILSSTRADWPYGLSPGGLPAAEEYMGHTFWDQDIWMYPFLLLLQPDLARASLRYRYDRLPAARKIARKYGFKGAMFPWESAFTGLETSPGEKYGKNQNHITGDIAYAAKLYWWATKDRQWLRQYGYQLVKQTAEFWASRVQYRGDVDKYVINHVMPPDEYQYPVNNSVYTNVVAKQNLEFATEVSEMLGQDVPEDWPSISKKMFIPFDEETQYHPEYEGYNLNITVKQADTILIGYPLMYNMDAKIRANDLKLYEERTDPNGPAMTHSMFAIGWLELGEKERAEKPFHKNFENINGPFKIWSEQRQRRGAVNFITGAGGFLQSVINGYGGLRMREESVEFNPTLPPSSTKMTITGVHYLGNKLELTVTKDGVKLRCVTKEEIAPNLEVVQDGKKTSLEVGKTIALALGKGEVRMSTGQAHSAAPASHSSLIGTLCAFLIGATRLSFV